MSMVQSLRMLAHVTARQRIAVLGDMKELGDHTRASHERVGEWLGRSNVDVAYWVGDEGVFVAEGFARTARGKHLNLCESAEALVAVVGPTLRKGDAVLVKASRACNLDRFVEGLRGFLETKG